MDALEISRQAYTDQVYLIESKRAKSETPTIEDYNKLSELEIAYLNITRRTGTPYKEETDAD